MVDHVVSHVLPYLDNTDFVVNILYITMMNKERKMVILSQSNLKDYILGRTIFHYVKYDMKS